MFTYHYNAQDRLVQVDDTNGAVIATYYYDPFGRRLWKEVSSERTCFFYADEGLVAEYNAAGNELASYGYRPDATWTTDPLWLKRDGEYYFYQNDHLGTPQKLVKQNGAVVWSASCTAFGQATLEIQEIPSNLRFPGQYADAETGWIWHQFFNNDCFMEEEPPFVFDPPFPYFPPEDTWKASRGEPWIPPLPPRPGVPCQKPCGKCAKGIEKNSPSAAVWCPICVTCMLLNYGKEQKK